MMMGEMGRAGLVNTRWLDLSGGKFVVLADMLLRREAAKKLV
jgi:hypothetical protein